MTDWVVCHLFANLFLVVGQYHEFYDPYTTPQILGLTDVIDSLMVSYERIRDSVFRYLPTVDQVGAIPREHLISDVCILCCCLDSL